MPTNQFITTDKLKEVMSRAPQGMDKRVLLKKMIERGHEIEGLNTSFNPLSVVTSMPKSLVRFGKDIASIVLHPQQTLEGLSSLGQGAVYKLADAAGVKLSEDAQEKKAFVDKTFNELFVQRYGSIERMMET